MKRLLYIIIGVFLLQGCSERQEYRAASFRAEAVMNDHPDSALLILDSLGQHEKEFGRHFWMQYLLHRTNAENKSFVKFTTDSVAKDLVEYFDSHGTVNEQVLSNYLLGMAYSDMGEAPKAINSFQNAIEAADTIIADFNFHQLSCAYSQMADIFRFQLLLTNEIEARNKASYYAFRANQIKWGIYNQAMTAGAYILLNKKDSAEIILKSVLEQYQRYGYTQEVLRYSKKLLFLYTQNPQRLTEAKVLMDKFEAESELYDEHHELPPSQRQYYDYKGKYYESLNQLDSAEFYYRKIYRPEMSYSSQDPMYRGLLSVFSKRHQADSIAKYAQLYCMANDSSIALKDRELVAQMAASYNYTRFQREAYQSDIKAYRTLIGFIIAMVLLAVFFVSAFLLWRYYRKKYRHKIEMLKVELADITDEYEENLRRLQMLESSRHKVIDTIKQETIDSINQEYEKERASILLENEILKKKIDELKRNDNISKYLSVSETFAKEAIVKRILSIAGLPIIKPVTEEEWSMLTNVVRKNYSSLYHDLCQRCNTPQDIRVCVLTALGIGSDAQAYMLNTTKQRVSNVKFALNKALFNEPSSRTLHKNLVVHYNFYGFEGKKLSPKRKCEL